MPRPSLRFLSAAVFAALVQASPALAHDWRVGDVRVIHPIALATVPGQKNGAVYLTLENSGKQTARLVRLASPVAARAELHVSTLTDNVMRMREIDAIDVKPNESVKMRPGNGPHVMLVDLKKPLAVGDRFPMTVEFADGAKAEVTVFVQKARSSPGDAQHHH